MRITVTERLPVDVACLRYTGPFGEPLGRFWRSVVAPRLADHGLVDCPRYGVVVDDPRTTAPDRCRYYACVALPAGLTLPDAAPITIPGGRIAVTTFKGTSAVIGAAWAEFVAAVLADPANRLEHSRHPYEHYPRGAPYDARTGVFSCELCLPLADA
jgi:AraC family transcriptional regulator